MIRLDKHDIKRFVAMVADATRVVITCHVAPDGDAIGSSLALYHLLRAMGKRPAVITPDSPPRSLTFLPGIRNILAATRAGEHAKVHIASADLIVMLDFNTLMRIDRLQPLILSSNAPRVLIDHHLNPDAPADVTISHPKASSTCYLLYEVIKAAGWEQYIDKQVAECIYTGMMTDTGNFSYNSNDPDLYLDIAELIRYGIDKDRLYKLACNTCSLDQLRLCSYALYEKMRVYPEHRAALIALSDEGLRRFNYQRGDTEGLVNRPLSVPEIQYSVFMRQDEPDFVKLSLRSKGTFPVNKICEDHFGGGGHLNAAGGELYCTLDEAIARFEAIMDEYDCYLEK